jgi:hypothetical protein
VSVSGRALIAARTEEGASRSSAFRSKRAIINQQRGGTCEGKSVTMSTRPSAVGDNSAATLNGGDRRQKGDARQGGGSRHQTTTVRAGCRSDDGLSQGEGTKFQNFGVNGARSAGYPWMTGLAGDGTSTSTRLSLKQSWTAPSWAWPGLSTSCQDVVMDVSLERRSATPDGKASSHRRQRHDRFTRASAPGNASRTLVM